MGKIFKHDVNYFIPKVNNLPQVIRVVWFGNEYLFPKLWV